jgi:putative ABC transport system substrate-binding protein
VNRRELMSLIGGAAALGWPLVTRAQQRIPVIGWLSAGSAESDNIPARLIAFRRGLSDAGYVEGENVAIEYRWAESQYDRAPDLVADLVRRQVSVIFAVGGFPMAFAAKAATTTIPIIFNLGGDPVQLGLVASLNRPGGNVTGVAELATELAGKRLDLLHELVPAAAVVALLVNPTNTANRELETSSLRDVANSLGLQLHVLSASSAGEIDAAFATLAELRASALIVSVDTLFTSQRTQIVALAARHAVPAIYGWREYPAEGGLMSYGPNLADSYRLAAVYVAKILKGTSPADLPVEQSVKIELVINLKTAKTLGLTIPLTIIGRADEVIE